MLFNSIHFLIFFILVLATYFLLTPRYRWTLLLAASVYFYMYFVPIYILILFAIIIIDYYAAIFIEQCKTARGKRLWLVGSLLANIGVLIVFKYWNFIGENLNGLSSLLKGPELVPPLNIILPIGLSFHTFQSMAYTLEVARGNFKAERHLGVYATYVMFFPQLVAGPIERPQGLLYQLKNVYAKLNQRDFFIGLAQIAYGFFTKVVVADLTSVYVDNIYANYKTEHGFPVLLAFFLFPIQIYGDFSGYSNIAIGSARMMGYKLMENFKTPFFSKTHAEFWRRWHISLSTWLRDYTFQPMVIFFRDYGKWGIAIATVLNFLVSGIWHGASWNFVIMGFISGVFIAGEILLNINSKKFNKTTFKKIQGVLYAFCVYSLAAVFFRAVTFEQATTFIGHIFSSDFFNFKAYDKNIFTAIVFMCSLFISFEFFVFRNHSFDGLYDKKPKLLLGMSLFLVLTVLLFGVENGNQFIYFQF